MRTSSRRAAPTELETEINRLNERMAAGTNLRSCASQIRLGGEFRYRAAYYDELRALRRRFDGGDGSDDDATGYWVDMRDRLNFQYDFGCDVTAFAELQSHWACGDVARTARSSTGTATTRRGPGAVGMYQAWLEFRNIFCRPELSTRIGRQEIVLGNQFQFGNADWYNGIVHDGIRVDWKSNCWSLTALGVEAHDARRRLQPASRRTSPTTTTTSSYSRVLHVEVDSSPPRSTPTGSTSTATAAFAQNSGAQLGFDDGVPLSACARLLPHVRRPRRRDDQHRVRARLQRRGRDPDGHDPHRRDRASTRTASRPRPRSGYTFTRKQPLPRLRARSLRRGPG